MNIQTIEVYPSNHNNNNELEVCITPVNPTDSDDFEMHPLGTVYSPLDHQDQTRPFYILSLYFDAEPLIDDLIAFTKDIDVRHFVRVSEEEEGTLEFYTAKTRSAFNDDLTAFIERFNEHIQAPSRRLPLHKWEDILRNIEEDGGDVEVLWLDDTDEYVLCYEDNLFEDGFTSEEEARTRLDRITAAIKGGN